MHDSFRRLPKIITRKLRLLERTLRTYAAADGVATSILAAVALLVLDFGLDRFFELSRPFRAVLLLGLLVLFGRLVWRRIVCRAFAGFHREQWALILERYVPSLNESLMTALQPGPDDGESGSEHGVHPALMRQTVRNAVESLRGVDVRRFFRYGRLAGRLALAFLALAAASGACFAFPESAETWFSRNILLSGRDWPRRSELVVEGFENGRVRVRRGDSFTLNVRARTSMPLVPDSIRLRLGTRDGGYRTLLLDRFRIETTDGADWRVFSHAFPEMLESLPLLVRGADSTIDDLLIEVVPPPVLTDIRLRQTFPKYMNREDRTVSPGGRTNLPDGTAVTVEAMSSKPLRQVRVAVDRSAPESVREAASDDFFDSFAFSLPGLRKDTLLEFSLEDVDFLQNRQPVRLEFSIVKDRPPSVTARLEGIGNVVTPQAVLPVVGEITDDHGLAAAQFRYALTRTPAQNIASEAESGETDPAEAAAGPETAPDSMPGRSVREGTAEIAGLGASKTIFSFEQPFSLAELDAVPGDAFSLRVEAADRFDLDVSDGQTGVGARWTLEVVSPERLRSLLEVREIALRQRFEVLIGEVERTKSLIAEISLEPTEEHIQAAETMTLPGDVLRGAEESVRRRELETRKKTFLDTISREQATPARYHVSRTLRDTRKEVYELRTLIESFRLIRLEMINNRIFSEESEQRIDRGIILPIQALVDVDFPETDRLIELLDEALDLRDRPMRDTACERQKTVLDRFDLVLRKMLAIRDNMVSMESFNEAIEILRSIIKQQRQLRDETRQRKDRRLRNLLD